MNPLLVRLGQAAIRRGRTEGVSPEFAESYPTLSAVMSGVAAENGQAGVPAMTVRIFWEGGKLKANIGRWGHPTCLWLTIPDECKCLESIEQVLAAGGGDIRAAKQQ